MKQTLYKFYQMLDFSESFHLQSELRQKEADQMMRHILEEIIGGMRTPERPSSPIDAYITDEEIFSRCNPKVCSVFVDFIFIIHSAETLRTLVISYINRKRMDFD